jgi:hypothetical protein
MNDFTGLITEAVESTFNRFFYAVSAHVPENYWSYTTGLKLQHNFNKRQYFNFVFMTMDYTINVQEVEHLQAISSINALEQIFDRARRTIIGGGAVLLVRVSAGGEVSQFDEITNEEDLAAYRNRVFLYLE